MKTLTVSPLTFSIHTHARQIRTCCSLKSAIYYISHQSLTAHGQILIEFEPAISIGEEKKKGIKAACLIEVPVR